MAKKRISSKSRAKKVARPKRKISTAKSKSAPKKPSAQSAELDRIKRLIRAHGETLLKRPNVTSVAVGWKTTGDKKTNVPALQFSVERKLVPEALAAEAIPPLPKAIEFEGVQIPTDIVQRNYKPSYQIIQLEAKSPRKVRQDPIIGGISVAHVSETAGTIGAIVRDITSGAPVILSNWHVLSGANGKSGDAIVQPGPFDDDRTDRNLVGRLLRSHLGIAGDCALASIENRKIEPKIFDLNVQVDRIGKPELGDLVVKSGRTTDVTFGVVSRVDGLFKISYDGVGEQAIGGFEIEPAPRRRPRDNEISKGGDSGSCWMAAENKTGKATNTMLGLHFAGDSEGTNGEFALACNANSVFEKLEIAPFSTPGLSATERQRKATSEVERAGFDGDFLEFRVPMPTFIKRVNEDLKGLNGTNRIDYCHFTVWLSGKRTLPVCVAWNIDGGRKKSLSRKGIDFVKDSRGGLEEFQAGDELYADNDLDRGHVARRDDLVWGDSAEAKQANIDSFFFTNMTPQHKAFNQSSLKGKWGLLENAILDDVVLRDLRVSVLGGPILAASDMTYRGVKIPREFWKVVCFTDDEDDQHKIRAFILTQKDLLRRLSPEALELDEFRWYQVPLSKVETSTGIRFSRDLHRLDTKFPQTVHEPARLIVGAEFFSR